MTSLNASPFYIEIPYGENDQTAWIAAPKDSWNNKKSKKKNVSNGFLISRLSRSIMCVWERTIQQVFSSKSCVFSSFWWRRSHRSTNCCRRPTVQMDVLYLANLPPVNNTSWQGHNEYPQVAQTLGRTTNIVLLLHRLKISFEQKDFILFYFFFYFR